MRFADGAWRMVGDVTPTYLARVDGAELGTEQLLLHVSSRPESERGATLQGHMFTVRITSPLDNVFRISVTHHKGRREHSPKLALDATPRELACTASDAGFRLRSGALELQIDRGPWALQFSDARGRTLTRSPPTALGLMAKAGAGVFLREQLSLGVGELVYGLGERFQAFCRNGQSVDMWNEDAGTCSDKAYKNIPFFSSSKGYGVLVNTPARVSFEIGTERVMRAQFAVPGEELDYFFMFGPNPKQVLNRLGALTGRPALPPAWSFGLWLSTSFTTQYDEKTVQGLVDGMAARRIPLHVFHFDCFWMQAHHWCNFEWDEAAFPDPPGMLARLEAKGLHVCVWINPCIAERSRLFDEACGLGYLLLRPNGDVWQGPYWQAGMAYVDFTNPEAARWFQNKLRPLLRMGVDAFKTDAGDDVPTDVAYFDGTDSAAMRNYYSFLYNKTVFELLEQERGSGEACVFARAATATCQRFPVHWGGDPEGTYESMAETLRGGLSLGLCGYGFWSHDIGGFRTTPTPSVYKRWIAFGLLSSHSRLHGNSSFRVPWLLDEEASAVLRHFTTLKCRLMPYLMASAVQAHTASQPMLRAMCLEFPDDPTCRTLDRQYMLGDGLLVAPVFDDSAVEYYLPRGAWTHLLTGESRSGGRWFHEEFDFFGLPVWVKNNALICVGTSETQVDYDLARGVRLVCGRLEGRVTLEARLVDAKGDPAGVLEVYHDGRRVRVKSPTLPDFQVHLPWAPAVVEVERGSLVKDDTRAPLTTRGVIVRADSGTASFRYDGETTRAVPDD
jgi:alpha-D-xyloside xylohydrolase